MTDYTVLEALLLSHLEQMGSFFFSNESVLKYAEVKGRTRLPERIKGTCRFQDEHAYSQKIHNPKSSIVLFFFYTRKRARLFLLKNVNLVKPSPDRKMIKLLTFLAKTR